VIPVTWAPQLPVLEKIVRAAAVYLFLLVAFRLTGKRQLGQMSSCERPRYAYEPLAVPANAPTGLAPSGSTSKASAM
jgi:hypothetical protein